MGDKKTPNIAYFCMEYGLENNFKQYAGGLGILAGDYIKGAKDYGFPVVGIGLMWKQGYTDQMIDENGKAYDSYHNRNYDFLIDTDIEVVVKIRNRDVYAKVWKVDCFNNSDLFLLDTDNKKNDEKWITGQLYGWFEEERVAQEMLLGIGGVRALRALNLDIDIYHFNEGHAVFAGFEIMREHMEEGKTFEEAWQLAREKAVFTTHTPVVQGNESHLIDRLSYMGAGNGLKEEQMIQIGDNPFNMTVAALRMCKKANAVAKLHCETANKMWSDIDGRCEIIAITNAIHLPTWVDDNIINSVENKSNLLKAHRKNKKELIEFIENKNGVRLEESILTVGFSRRAAGYKRSNFIFSDIDVIEKLFNEKKLQIVFSGKSHPLDDVGKATVENLVAMSLKYPKNVVFLENYDMEIGVVLTRGSDVWLNNPRRPKEASGTSGMKAAINGVLNFSILDGWWPEACEHGINGWQFGDGFESDDENILDAHDLKSLYSVLLNEVIPTYYKNKEKWIMMMQNSIRSCKDEFSILRMLDEYFEKLYKA
jgi:glycogen phosphorylase